MADMSHMMNRRQSGFTLIEVLVVTGILAVVLGVITACLAGGIRVWDTARTCSQLEGPVLVDLALIEKDWTRAIPFYGIACRGDSRQIVFPAIVRRSWNSVPEGVGAVDGLGTIRYVFDPGRKALLRKQWIFPDPEPPESASETLLAGLEECRFEYGTVPPSRGGTGGAGAGVTWADSWNVDTNVPGGVRLQISVLNAGGSVKLTRMLFLPARAADARVAE